MVQSSLLLRWTPKHTPGLSLSNSQIGFMPVVSCVPRVSDILDFCFVFLDFISHFWTAVPFVGTLFATMDFDFYPHLPHPPVLSWFVYSNLDIKMEFYLSVKEVSYYCNVQCSVNCTWFHCGWFKLRKRSQWEREARRDSKKDGQDNVKVKQTRSNAVQNSRQEWVTNKMKS